MMDLKTKAFLVGVGGDLALQFISSKRGNIAGLKSYFEQHGKMESLFIAGGLMFGASYFYELSGFQQSNLNLFMYGGALDVAFRYTRAFPSLDGYYGSLNPIQSVFWGGLPFIIANSIGVANAPNFFDSY